MKLQFPEKFEIYVLNLNIIQNSKFKINLVKGNLKVYYI